MDLGQKTPSIMTQFLHLPATLAVRFSPSNVGDMRGTTRGHDGDNPPYFCPDNKNDPKTADFAHYKNYQHITLESIERLIDFNLSHPIEVSESHKKCCLFCLRNIGESLPIGKTHAMLKAQYGTGIKKAVIQESKKILADNGFMKAVPYAKTNGVQYLWYSPEELAQQIQTIHLINAKNSRDNDQDNVTESIPQKLLLNIRKRSLKPLQHAIQTTLTHVKKYYGFDDIKIKKAWLINMGVLVGTSLAVLNITPLINTVIQDTHAYYLLGPGGTWTLLYSIVATSIWLLRTYTPVKIAFGLCLTTTLFSLPIHAIINNSGGVIGYLMVDTLFKLHIPEDVVVLLYGHLFIASTIPMGNPLFKIALWLKQSLNPLHDIAVHDPINTQSHTDMGAEDQSLLPDLVTHTPTERQKIEYMQHLLDARDLNKTHNMIQVVDLINGLRTTVYIVQTSARFNIGDLEKQVKNMQRSLGVNHVNIIPSIEGKPSISHIEVPKHKETKTIYLNAVLDSSTFKEQSRTHIPLGQDIYGKTLYRDLTQFPHIAIAGTTNSGKSVQVNSMIISLMAKNSPDELQFIMIDPKMLELSIYANSPHLARPVITHMDQAKGVLEQLVNEMEYRYTLLAHAQVRKLSTYNQHCNPRKNNVLFESPMAENILNPATQKQHKLPLIVCVIDEMADLIMQYGKEVEELIARIAQKSRAAGIHLILATQRPDSDVMTGLIKANIPSRIAFSVDSSSNSRIILDQKGAEVLLGKGDMLTKTPQDKELHRLQGYFIDEKQIVQFLNKQIV